MKVETLLESVDFQTEVCICYYDEDKNERVEIDKEVAADKEIRFMYCDQHGKNNHIIFIEVEMEM